ncbi:MAG: hypothetical protein IKB02_09930 [Clostridia bacterium]|nr:hypothetical protein [Clostridia bacterium]
MSEKKDVYTKTIEGINFDFDTKEEGDAVATAYYLLEDPNKNVYEVINTYRKTNKVGNKQILHGVRYDDTTNPGTNGDNASNTNTNGDNASNTNTNGDTYASLKAYLDQYRDRAFNNDEQYRDKAYSNAEQYLGSAYSNAESLRGASYAQALKERQEAEALAEIQRKRGVVDASTMAEQQKATYGANAEQVGRMGLQVSGYSDYLNSQAYAAGMAARQSANAQATDIKRQALYQEAIARLDADKAYSQAKADADKVYFQARSEADKIYSQARSEAYKTYYGALNEIGEENGSVAKITDADVQKAEEKGTEYYAQGNFVLAAKEGVTVQKLSLDTETGKAEYANLVGRSMPDIYGNDAQIGVLKTEIENGAFGASKSSVIKAISAAAKNDVLYETDSNGVQTEKSAVTASVAYKKAQMLSKDGLIDEETWREIEGTYKMRYEEGYVSIYSDDFNIHSFGNFDDGEKQTELIESIKAMVEGKIKGYRQGDGKQVEIKKGYVVYVNYGHDQWRGDCYEYLDTGLFKKISVEDTADKQIILPEGFYFEQGEVSKGKVVEVSKDSPSTVFGNFAGSKDKDSEQAKYTDKIIEMVTNGDIEEGEYVCVNFGGIFNTDTSYYRYLGNNKLMSVDFVPDSDYVRYPEGYKESFWKHTFAGGAVKE